MAWACKSLVRNPCSSIKVVGIRAEDDVVWSEYPGWSMLINSHFGFLMNWWIMHTSRFNLGLRNKSLVGLKDGILDSASLSVFTCTFAFA